jgi:dihydroceramidase
MLTRKQAVCETRDASMQCSTNTTDAAYHLILWRVWATRCLDGDEKKFMLDWAPLRSVPQVVPRPSPVASVAGNGLKKTQ